MNESNAQGWMIKQTSLTMGRIKYCLSRVGVEKSLQWVLIQAYGFDRGILNNFALICPLFKFNKLLLCICYIWLTQIATFDSYTPQHFWCFFCKVLLYAWDLLWVPCLRSATLLALILYLDNSFLILVFQLLNKNAVFEQPNTSFWNITPYRHPRPVNLFCLSRSFQPLISEVTCE